MSSSTPWSSFKKKQAAKAAAEGEVSDDAVQQQPAIQTQPSASEVSEKPVEPPADVAAKNKTAQPSGMDKPSTNDPHGEQQGKNQQNTDQQNERQPGASKPLPSMRKKARQLLVQALYQWQLSGADLHSIEAEFFTDNKMKKVDIAFFRELLHGIPKQLEEVDGAYQSHLDRDASELDPISRALLRLGSYELCFRIDVPYKVAINEAVNLAKTFGPTDAYKYINGILDKVAAEKRSIEVTAQRRR